jgi:pimeloyl-ACP methyl ester carboxylesterase
MLHAETNGTSPRTLLFVHGNSQSAETWRPVVKHLEDSFTCIAVDLPGHGKSFRSTQPAKDYGIPGMASHLKEFIEAHADSDYVIVSNSGSTNLVGEIAGSLVNCKGIMLIGASVIGEGITADHILKSTPNLKPFFTAEPSESDLEGLITEGSLAISVPARKTYKDIFLQTDPAFRKHWFDSISNQEWTDEIKNLESLHVPVAVVYGENDNFTFIDYLEKTDMKKWRDKIITIPQAGHLIQDDQPQEVAALVAEFANDVFK